MRNITQRLSSDCAIDSSLRRSEPCRCVIFWQWKLPANYRNHHRTRIGGWINQKFADHCAACSFWLRRCLAAPSAAPGNSAASTSSSSKSSYRVADEIEKDYNEAVATITSNYSGDIDYEKATQAAIQGMLSTLDPHSAYFPYSEFKKLKEDQDSRFYGIGVTIVQHRDGVYIQSAVEGTPAARLGLRYGDRILEVDGKDARDWSSEQVSKNVRGGTRRAGNDQSRARGLGSAAVFHDRSRCGSAAVDSQRLHDSSRHRLYRSDRRISALERRRVARRR